MSCFVVSSNYLWYTVYVRCVNAPVFTIFSSLNDFVYSWLSFLGFDLMLFSFWSNNVNLGCCNIRMNLPAQLDQLHWIQNCGISFFFALPFSCCLTGLLSQCSLTGVQVPCNTMWQHVLCLSMWKSWMQTHAWFLETRLHKLVLATLLVGFLHCTKKLQVWRTATDFNAMVWSSTGLKGYIVCLADTVRREAATIMAVFPSPNEVMSILVQVCRQ